MRSKVLEIEGCDRYRAPLVNEGGAIHVDGEGTALVTEECLLNPNRNPGIDTGPDREPPARPISASSVIWLGKGVFDDETDGHIDNLACFVRPGEVALTWTDDQRDPQYAVSHDASSGLTPRATRAAAGSRCIKLPMPGPLRYRPRRAAGVQVARSRPRPRAPACGSPRSYVNFYIANGGIVMPLLDPRTDKAAAAKLKPRFSRPQVIGVPAREILLGGGNIHCITQQVPR